MLVGFRRRFAPLVWEGSKRQTIRLYRKTSRGELWLPRAGQLFHCYVDPRQKTMQRLGTWPCQTAEHIVIVDRPKGMTVSIEGNRLKPSELDLLAWRDGFRPDGSTWKRPGDAFLLMSDYWRREAGSPFLGLVLHWLWDVETRNPQPPPFAQQTGVAP